MEQSFRQKEAVEGSIGSKKKKVVAAMKEWANRM